MGKNREIVRKVQISFAGWKKNMKGVKLCDDLGEPKK